MENRTQAQRWAQLYTEGRSEWHLNEVNPVLIKFWDRLIVNSTKSKEETKIFYPLCGKSVDITYFYRTGFQVFGIEFVNETIEALSTRDKLDLIFDPVQSTYSTPDNRLIIFCGSIFDCPIEKWGPFDILWDRTGICSIGWDQVDDYVEFIHRSVKGRDFRYMLQVFDYQKNTSVSQSSNKKPRQKKDLTCIPFTQAELEDLFSDWAVEFLERNLVGEESLPELRSIVPPDFDVYEATYLISLTKS